MDMVEYWKLVVLQRYAKFDGRAGRAEYWWFVLANIIVYIALLILMRISGIFIILAIGFWLAIIIPSIAVAIRRLHDTNKSGWFLLIALIPLIGAIILIVFYATQGDPGPNNYGAPDPGVPALNAA